jgi:hypothetical protein
MVFNINEIEYVLVNVIINDDNRKRLEGLMDKHKCIVQDFILIRGNSLFTFLGLYSPKVKLAIFVPTKNIIEFNNQLYI